MTTLKKIDSGSSEGVDASLINLFELPATNVAVNKTTIRQLLPIAALSQEGPYVFRVFADNQFIDLARTYLYLNVSIERKSGTQWIPLDSTQSQDKNVSVVNNFGHSFVKSLKLSINGIECFDSGALYSYRAYILQELGHSHEVRAALFDANCYANDDFPQNHPGGRGFKARQKRFLGATVGKQCETMVKLHFDLAKQNKLMMNNSDLIFTIHRNSDDFLLLTPDYTTGTGATETTNVNNSEYRIHVHDVQLFIACMDLTQSLNNAIAKQLESSVAKYPVRKIETRNVFLNKGRVDLSHNIFVNILPRRMIIAFTLASAFSGNPKLSPFEFSHANLRTISVEANGNSYPATPYYFDFDNQKFLRAFVDMYAGLGMDDGDRTMSINIERFLNGWCFYVIPMQSTLEDYGQNFEIIRNGTTAIKLHFKEPINDSLEMIVIGEFDSIISIDSSRVLSSDHSVV